MLNMRYSRNTPVAVSGLLEMLYKGKQVVRIFYGFPETGEDWLWRLHGTNLIGTVCRSHSKPKVPMLVSVGATRGEPILTDCIVKMKVNDLIIYQHPKYHLPEFHLEKDGKSFVVSSLDGRATFKTEKARREWIRFVKGFTDVITVPESEVSIDFRPCFLREVDE